MDNCPFLEMFPDYWPPLFLHRVHGLYSYLLTVVSLSLQLKPMCRHGSPFRQWTVTASGDCLRGEKRKQWWLTQAESAHRRAAGITFPWLSHHRGGWVWAKVMGVYRAFASRWKWRLQAIFIYNFFLLPTFSQNNWVGTLFKTLSVPSLAHFINWI